MVIFTQRYFKKRLHTDGIPVQWEPSKATQQTRQDTHESIHIQSTKGATDRRQAVRSASAVDTPRGTAHNTSSRSPRRTQGGQAVQRHTMEFLNGCVTGGHLLRCPLVSQRTTHTNQTRVKPCQTQHTTDTRLGITGTLPCGPLMIMNCMNYSHHWSLTTCCI